MLAWIYHYLPFYTMSRQLFLHHYLPAHLCSALVAGAVFDFVISDTINYPISIPGRGLTRRRPKIVAVVAKRTWIIAGVVVGLLVGMFAFFTPLTYGTPGLNPDQVNRRRLLDAWTLVSCQFFRLSVAILIPFEFITALREMMSAPFVACWN